MSHAFSKQKIFKLWVESSQARWRHEVLDREIQINPWESDDPQMRAAWDALTRSENLADLEEWGIAPDKMNSTARELTAKAIEWCRKRVRWPATQETWKPSNKSKLA
jgi:hypothetical protein